VGAFAVIQGVEHEELFTLDEAAQTSARPETR
jgi:hypothetical protein